MNPIKTKTTPRPKEPATVIVARPTVNLTAADVVMLKAIRKELLVEPSDSMVFRHALKMLYKAICKSK